MNIENQCISLELAKKLMHLGIKQDSLFYWYYAMHDGKNSEWKILYTNEGLMPDRYSAFTISELFEIIPAFIDIGKHEPFNGFYLALNKRTFKNIQYIVNYHCDTSFGDQRPPDLIEHNIYDENLSSCLAKLLIYLIENNYFNVNDRHRELKIENGKVTGII